MFILQIVHRLKEAPVLFLSPFPASPKSSFPMTESLDGEREVEKKYTGAK
jgi:hypothetical protein